jgi:hypothetical protein
VLGIVQEVAHGSENAARAPRDFLALVGQGDARFATLDQAQLELVLELLDLHAERGLADGAGLGCVAEMPGFGQGFEVTQLPQGDHTDKLGLCVL